MWKDVKSMFTFLTSQPDLTVELSSFIRNVWISVSNVKSPWKIYQLQICLSYCIRIFSQTKLLGTSTTNSVLPLLICVVLGSIVERRLFLKEQFHSRIQKSWSTSLCFWNLSQIVQIMCKKHLLNGSEKTAPIFVCQLNKQFVL